MTTIDQIMELADHWNSSVVDSIWLSEQGCDTTNIDDQTIEFKEKLKAAITELSADAARYEWLSNYLPSMDETHDDALVSCSSKAQIDAVIDEAMKGTP